MPPAEPTLIDRFQRRITYLRLSVTDRCDLRCAYCMPREMVFLPRKDLLTLDELHRLALAFIDRGVRAIRLTGGEPLVRRDVMDLVTALGRHVGQQLDELTLTTNGTHLADKADALASAGVRRVNVSLDTLDRVRFTELTGADRLGAVLDGIAAARDAGLEVKLNVVALRDESSEGRRELIEWAHGHGHSVTLIEVMPMGEVAAGRADQFVPLTEVRRELETRWTLTPSTHRTGGPARYWHIAETGGRIGFITPLSDNFCAGCNRLRVTATGQLHPCLGGTEAVDLRAALRSGGGDQALASALETAMRIKPERHRFAISQGFESGPARHMSVTGG
ncbi:GTP 3',8-cyclase MoaA [Parafrankia sp. BMG5.11]|uniref:GTP 3',8-cyclase MoaA n=1 Tax=Parafrankia sp. BMG5.11 TaxID=222540 RepID=UPI00103F169B|nr:GTP 3',8-cyclase MoaA [Parafrankia sp. BMG5.11]TCJ38330.1 GTP 3',8-cyclase MoaA [Parafrankia sp. BMG5.11]